MKIRYSCSSSEYSAMPTVRQSTWTCHDAPFSTKLDPKRFFMNAPQEEALARLHFLVDHRRRLGLLEGPAGCGKTMLMDIAGRIRQQGRQVVTMNLMGLDAGEFLWRLAAGLGANPAWIPSLGALARD